MCALELPWVNAKKEVTAEKGLDTAIADKIGEYMKQKDELLRVSFFIANT
jgi:histidyl-tRNA synthetase